MSNSSYPNSQTNPTSATPVWQSHPDFIGAASTGLLLGVRSFYVAGHAPNLSAGTNLNIDVCGQGTKYPFLATSQQLKISSSAATDNAAGTGARRLLIMGLDANFVEQREYIIPNGVGAVNTTLNYFRINGFAVVDAGSSGYNDGTITLQLVAGGSVQGIIQATEGISQQAVFTTPSGYIGILHAAQFAVEGAASTKSAQMALSANYYGTAKVIGAKVDCTAGTSIVIPALVGIAIDEKKDATVRVLNVAANGTDVSAAFSVILMSKLVYPNITI